jgi:hypothetical protein
MSQKFERWKELAARCLSEQDPAKLTALANEINLVLTEKVLTDKVLTEKVLTQKSLYLDSSLRAVGSNEEGRHDVLKPSAEGKVCFT